MENNRRSLNVKTLLFLKLLLSMRLFAAFWSNISDCDETYNYWEPLHFLLYGSGFQTWEYSPNFALRSYMYLMMHAIPALNFQKVLNMDPVGVFYTIRCLLAVLCAMSEFYFIKAILKEFGSNVALLVSIFQTFAAGMFISSAAFLPSSWCMIFSTAAYSAWIFRKFELAIFFTALSALLGWPFSALLGLPIVIDLVLVRWRIRTFILWSVISLAVILLPTMAIDSAFYGRLIIAPWNIIKYNVFTTNRSSSLYGVEPLSYYLFNGFLNFNFVWVLAFLTPFLIIFSYIKLPKFAFRTKSVPFTLLLMPLYLWILVFFFQPHKEERFLFPIYPLISLHAAISCDAIYKLLFPLIQKTKKIKYFIYVSITTILLLNISRIFAHTNYYRAPLDLMLELRNLGTSNKETNVCLAKDWYLSPSSFFLPSSVWNLKLVRSDFTGMLPVPYTLDENATKVVHDYFNDRNVGNSSQLYYPLEQCNLLLYIDNGRSSPLEPRYHLMEEWLIIKAVPFINLRNSHKFFRSFFVPFVSKYFVQFHQFYLLERVSV